MQFETVRVEIEDSVATVTIDRPKALNALSSQVLEELDAAIAGLEEQDSVRAIVLTGGGEKSFVAGADIKEMSSMTAAEAKAYAAKGQAALFRIENSAKPVIAAVNGFALGGGCELAMACHIRLASSKARFGQPEVNLGVLTGFGGSQRLPRLVGMGRALELILTGDMVGADEAHRIGLVNKVLEPEDLLPAAKDLAAKIASKAPLAVRWSLESALGGGDRPMPDACALEANLFGLAFSTKDQKEGMAAFLEKRDPDWQGR